MSIDLSISSSMVLGVVRVALCHGAFGPVFSFGFKTFEDNQAKPRQNDPPSIDLSKFI